MMCVKGLQLLKLGLYRLDMACDGPIDVMGWRGAMDIMQGEDVTCQHDNYTNNITGYGWASHGLWGDGVLPTSWMLVVLLYRTHSFPLACLTSSYNVILTTGIDSRVGWSLISFLFEINVTVKKSNPMTKPHDSPQGCTVRPRKGAGHCSLGGVGGGGDNVKQPHMLLLQACQLDIIFENCNQIFYLTKPPVNCEVKRHALVGPDIETPQRAVGRSLLHLRFPQVLYDNLNLYLKELFVPGSYMVVWEENNLGFPTPCQEKSWNS